MTTGRINQVTIVPGEHALPSALHAGLRSSLKGALSGGPDAARPAGRRSYAHRTPPTIHVPPLSFPPSGPPHHESHHEAVIACAMRPARGGDLGCVTSGDGYQRWLSPECLRVRVAIGQ